MIKCFATSLNRDESVAQFEGARCCNQDVGSESCYPIQKRKEKEMKVSQWSFWQNCFALLFRTISLYKNNTWLSHRTDQENISKIEEERNSTLTIRS